MGKIDDELIFLANMSRFSEEDSLYYESEEGREQRYLIEDRNALVLTRIREYLPRLPEKQKLVIECVLSGLCISVISKEVLGISKTSCKRLYNRALIRLRKYLELEKG